LAGLSVVELAQSIEMMMIPDAETILKALFELIVGEKSDDEIQGELIDLLGFELFETVGKILENRSSLKEQLFEAKRQNVSRISSLAPNRLVPLRSQGGNGGYCQQVVVQTRGEAEMRKEMRREQKKLNREMNRITHAFGEEQKLEIELAQREIYKKKQLELEALKWEPSLRAAITQKDVYPFVFDGAVHAAETTVAINGLKYALPEGSERIDKRAYEIVKVPPVKRDSVQDVKHVYIKDLDEIGQLGFKGFEKLNTIQSIVFEQAYRTRENLLICAPTGAGKTNIAMLSILNTIHEHRTQDGTIMKDDFKIIYIAPMKALATEMAESFGKRLAPLGLKVRELTGDTTLSKKEIDETQMLILTPEKWDVVTRKTGDNALASLVRLLIIDEVHLLHDDRGPVIETIVARTLRQVEMSQTGIRIVGLSATLPNYVDVARFLRVNPYKGLFFFDGRFRPVPLSQKFIGVRQPTGNFRENMQIMDDVCYDEAIDYVKRGHQVLVFVHARNATANLAEYFRMKAAKQGDSTAFVPAAATTTASYQTSKKNVMSSRNGQLNTFFQSGFGIHHAGLQRADRILMEKVFAQGHISILFCTATLAWGVNLPAHAVIIRGTEVFDAEKGAFADLGVLDVQQIFGRAGRPQFENEGHGIIITWLKSIDKYLGMLVRQAPIESQFVKKIHDNLNAEIALGTVSNIDEAVEWLSYSYFTIRAKINPMAYGMPHGITKTDPELRNRLTKMLTEVAEQLDKNHMIRYDSLNQFLSATDLGRIASNFYIKYQTIEMINEKGLPCTFSDILPDDIAIGLIAQATEFSQLKIREEEIPDLETLTAFGCVLPVRGGGLASVPGKVNVLMQAFISRSHVPSFSLMSETLYVQQNASRISRAFFEIALKKGWAHATVSLLTISKSIEKRMWPNQSPLRQLVPDFIQIGEVEKIEQRRMKEGQIYELTSKELNNMFRVNGERAHEALRMLPRVYVEASFKPITATIVQVEAVLTPIFIWNTRMLGKAGAQAFWVILENIDENLIVHQERVAINKKKVDQQEPQRIIFTIPIRQNQLSKVFQLRVASDFYIVEDSVIALSLHNCTLPEAGKSHTDLLPLDPLPVTVLNNREYEGIYPFKAFNPIQTQAFHALYHTDESVLLGAPTGSGKTCIAELAIFRLLNAHPGKKCVYIAPLKALVRERVADWQEKFEKRMGYKVLELSGDVTPDVATLNASPILIATPEKWDGVTRSWSTREYVRNVGLVIIDEIHLLGVERGNVLEAIVTRLKLVTRRSCLRSDPARLIGLSTALANAGDVGAWLGIKDAYLFNFRPAVRPVPVNVHISGFPGQHYCPRMALMNKPAFKAILTYSPHKPVIVFVASRRQTRLTAMAFISHLVSQDDPRQWLKCSPAELEEHVRSIRDENLKLTLPFGIGMHHAGLMPAERALVEHLFVERKIQVLIATATLAWGINMPAHLVIVKGTEYFDGKTGKYVDFPVTDVLQMMGRAGRPQFDDSAVAVIYVQDAKKNFYKRFLYEPFPVESSLLPQLANHVNAEINAGTITSRQQVMEYLAGTYLYRRLFVNPNFYGLDDLSEESLTAFLTYLIDEALGELVESNCIEIDEEEGTVRSTPFGRLASVYYLDHKSIRFLTTTMREEMSVEQALNTLTDIPEYAEIPVRHNEDEINAKMARSCRMRLTGRDMGCAHTKTNILFQSHFSRTSLQTDYRTDQRSVIECCVRILQAMREVASLNGWMSTALTVGTLQQMCHSGRWWDDHPLLSLPHLREEDATALDVRATVPRLQKDMGVERAAGTNEIVKRGKAKMMERTTLSDKEAEEVLSSLARWPILRLLSYSMDDGTTIGMDERGGERKAIEMDKGKMCTLRLRIENRGPGKYQSEAILPHWPKDKSASWLFSLGVRDDDLLLSSTPIPPVMGKGRATLRFRAPEKSGRMDLTLVIQSDCYLGIDQEYTIPILVR
ncbi:hypothetical protein PENTCL1PPCAC_6200, partial [Pristionchus entomophagus]